MPKRIQRKRTKGWKMPPNTVYVGRPTQWGNPYPIKGTNLKRETALALYRGWLGDRLSEDCHFLDPLKGKNLACWCPLDKPCHADILLKFLEALKTKFEAWRWKDRILLKRRSCFIHHGYKSFVGCALCIRKEQERIHRGSTMTWYIIPPEKCRKHPRFYLKSTLLAPEEGMKMEKENPT